MKVNCFIVIILFVFIVGAFVSGAISSENYGITSPITSSGGGESESGNFILRTVLGIVSGVMESLNFQTSLGFFYGIDTTASNVEIVYPVDGTTYYSYVGDINYTVDIGTHCWYQKNSNPISSPVLLGVNWTNVYENSVIGPNTWTVFCNDSAGNVGSDSVSFTVDNIVPNLYFSGDTPDNEEVLSQSYFTVNVTSSDASGEHSTFVDFDDSLVGWWKLENNYLDSSGNNNHGSCTSCPKVMGGKRGLGFEFDGVNDYIELSDDTTKLLGSNPNEWSYSVWFKTNGLVTSKREILSNYYSSGGDNLVGIWTGINSNGNTGQVFINVRGTDGIEYKYTTGDYRDSSWHHILVSIKKGFWVKGYIDGILFSESVLGSSNYIDNAPLRIGALTYSGSLTEFWNGSIDDVMIFDRALSESEVKSLYNAQNNQYGNFFDGLGNRVYNFTAYSQDKAGNVNSTSRSVEVNMAPGDVNVSILYDKPLNSRRGSLNVSWEDTSDGEDSFSIERSIDNSSFSEINTVSGVSGVGSIVSYIDSNLDDNKVYYYRVRSYAGGLYSGYSSVGANNTADRRGEYSPLLDLIPDSTNNKIDLTISEGDPNLVLYLPFEEGQGAVTSDWSGVSSDGVINEAVWSLGKNGNALYFDNLNDVINGNINGMNGGNYTLSAWVNLDAGGNAYFLSLSNNIRLSNYNSNFFDCAHKISGVWNSVSSGEVLPNGKWSYVSCVYDGISLKAYINGFEKNSEIKSNPPSVSTYRIGWPDGSAAVGGLIDEVRVYNKALTQEEIINDMQSGLVRKGLYRNVSGDNFVPIGGVFDNFSDSTSYVWNNNGGSWTKSGGVYQGPLSGEYVSVTGNSSLTNYIVEFDFKIVSGVHASLIFRANDAVNQFYQYEIYGGTNTLNGGNINLYKYNSGYSFLAVSNIPQLNYNQQYHAKAVVNENHFKLYLNDVLVLNKTDNSFSNGRAGVGVHSSNVVFDNFKITPLISSNKYNDTQAVDLEKPGTATSLGSSTHLLSTWTNLNNLNVNWLDANDFGTSYSYYSNAYDSSGNEDNLFSYNPYFETSSTSGWAFSNAVGGNWQITNNSAYQGNSSLHTPVASSGDQYAHTSKYFGENIAGRKFKISAYVKTNGVSANNIVFKTYWKTSTGSWIWQNLVSSNLVGGTSDWTKLEAVGVAPEGAYYSSFIIAPVTKNGQGEFWVDSVSLVEIKNATITSGVDGYATSLTNGASEVVSEVKDVDVNVRSKLFSSVGTGQDWYFNIKSKDKAGNWAYANQTVSHGPFWICNDVSGIVDSDGDDALGFINLTDSGNTCGCSSSDVTNSRRCSTTYDGVETGICSAIGVCDEPVINVTLVEPVHGDYVGNKAVFECDVKSNSQLNNVSLFTSFGGWSSKANSGISGLFGSGNWLIQNLNTQSNFIWNCLACDVNNYCDSAELNKTFNIDLTNPEINFVSPTPLDSSAQSEQTIVVNISSSDNFGEHSSFVDFNNSLVGWWRFDNNFGDSSGNENNGTCSGSSCPNLTNGPRGLAYEFDGVDDYVDMGNPFSFENKGTISFWTKSNINFPSESSSTKYRGLIGKVIGGGTGEQSIFIDWVGTNTNHYLRFGIGDSIGLQSLTVSNIDMFNSWNLITASWNGSLMRLYFNGVIIGQISQTRNPQLINNHLMIGKVFNPWNGSIDDVMIFDRALSYDEVESLYNAQSNQYVNNFSNLDDGFYSFRGYSQDMAGNIKTTEERTVEINNEPPEIEIFSPENITYVYGEGVWFNISASHEKGIDSCWFNLNDTENVTLSFIGDTNYSYLNESMFSGYYSANFQCNNTIGVKSEIANVNFTINSLPTVDLLYPIGGENVTNRTPEFSWQGNDINGDSLSYEIIIDEHKSGGGAICFDSYEESALNNYFIPNQDLKCLSDYGYYYTWKVRAHDGMNWGPYSDDEDFYVNALILVSLPNDEISFGSLDYLASNDTSDNSPAPLTIKNDGNVKINISASASQMWDVKDNDSEYYKVKVDNRSGFSNAFKWISSAFDWLNMSITGQVFLIDSLEYHDSQDSAEIDIYLEVPPNEGPGLKNSTIVFESKLAELEA